MGDCDNFRCVHSKRLFKKELQSWYKKIPVAEGLELVAEFLAGPKSAGNFKTLMLPFNDLESDSVVDFEIRPCWSCDDKPDSPVSPPLVKEPVKSVTPINQATDEPRQENLTPDTPKTNALDEASATDITSYYNQILLQTLLYQQQQQLHDSLSSLDQLPTSLSDIAQTSSAEVKPDATPSTPSTSELKIPDVKRKSRRKDVTPKKTYSSRELTAAVEAIQSGSVGTRRASQMYGVPRSTLRNQVFKAAEMNQSQRGGNEHNFRMHTTHDENSSSETPSPRSNPRANLSVAFPSSLLSPKPEPTRPGYTDTFQKHLQELQNKALLQHQASSVNPFPDMMNPLQFSYNPFLMQQYAGLAAMSGLDYMSPYTSFMMPYLPDMMKNLITQPRLHPATPSRPKHTVSGQKSPEANKEEEIKVPAYKPASNREPSDVKPPLPDLSSHNRNHSHQSLGPLPDSSAYFSQLNHVLSRQMKEASRSRCRKHKMEGQEDDESILSTSNNVPPGKKRPKRGQYRKYDSELLAQAVRAVQRGEMSVHRAGTFYGVPHSTLEYKVKERHLLRKKKIAEGAVAKANAEKSAGSSNGSTSDSETSERTSFPKEDQKMLPIYPQQSQSESSPSEAVNYTMDTSATDLLRKLQVHAEEKAQQLLRGSTGGPIFQAAEETAQQLLRGSGGPVFQEAVIEQS